MHKRFLIFLFFISTACAQTDYVFFPQEDVVFHQRRLTPEIWALLFATEPLTYDGAGTFGLSYDTDDFDVVAGELNIDFENLYAGFFTSGSIIYADTDGSLTETNPGFTWLGNVLGLTGDITQTGDHTMTGDLTVDGTTILGDGGDAGYTRVMSDGTLNYVGTGGVPYGGLYLHEGAVNIDISGAGQGVYVKVTGFTTGQSHDVTINSDAFNVDVVGVYKVDWQLSADSAGTGKIYDVDLFVNGVEQPAGSARRGFGAVGSLGSMSGTAMLAISDITHDVDLRIKEPGAGAGTDIDIFHANFNLMHIAGLTAFAPENVIFNAENVFFNGEQVVYP